MPAGRGTPVAAGPPVKPKPAPAPKPAPSPLVSALSHAVASTVHAAASAVHVASHAASHPAPAPAPKPAPKSVGAGLSSAGHAITHKPAPKPAGLTSALQHAVATATNVGRAKPSAAKGPLASSLASRIAAQRAKEAKFLQYARSVYDTMNKAGYLPPGATVPKMIVDRSLPDTSETVGKTIHFSPATVNALFSGGPDQAWAMNAIPHEIAHTMQPYAGAYSTPTEGGAQSYADVVTHSLWPRSRLYGDSNYAPYTQAIRLMEGPDYYMRRQFQPGTGPTPPPNLDFRASLSGAGMGGPSNDMSGQGVGLNTFPGMIPLLRGPRKKRT